MEEGEEAWLSRQLDCGESLFLPTSWEKVPSGPPRLTLRNVCFKDERPVLTEMFHIILMAKGKARARGARFSASPRGTVSGPLPGRSPMFFATARFWGNTGTVASYTAALQPLPMDCPIRYSSSWKPCQRLVSNGSEGSLFFCVKIA